MSRKKYFDSLYLCYPAWNCGDCTHGFWHVKIARNGTDGQKLEVTQYASLVLGRIFATKSGETEDSGTVK